ncbi:uncharacterized protein A1O9_08586 [Exophiala aquamarina CBS 119918]|uniref:Fungal N-terminal domain-containing protein n=1 Tax=Exophiala aquamarina CBS 119918 TaxID=1182545 RepID=A0A072PK14_9EURO|nr:uncharacterized protein A1O9_08586 [Exophiala aquamarina CBS 119918]KEF55835.1 hypothetical protein A1O9_08586 [Exophiala aquamarina CBS 119918]
MEIGLAIAGVLPLAQELHKMGKKYYKSFRRAPAEARRFGSLVEDVSDTLALFCKTASEMKERNIPLAKDKKATRAVRRLRKMLKASIQEIRSTFEILSVVGNHEYPWIERSLARFRWVTGDERDARLLIVNLNTTKLDITVLLTVFSVNIQLKIAKELEERKEPMPEYLIQELMLLKQRSKILKRRYKEVVKERDALVAARAPIASNRTHFMSLSQSFGQEVHEFAQEHMPAAEVILEGIVRDHEFASSTETTAESSNSGNIPPRQREARSYGSIFSDVTLAGAIRDQEEYGPDSASSVSFLSTRAVLGVTEWRNPLRSGGPRSE